MIKVIKFGMKQKIILGGNMLLSKRPEMHLPEKWPPYYSKASGCFVWDMNNKSIWTYLLWKLAQIF